MILFAGSEERGYFLEEPAKTKKMKVEYLGNAISIETQLTAILEKTMQYLVIDIEQYIDKADELATKIESIKRAKNCNVIIYAPGYVRESRIIQELNFRGIRFYIFAVGQADAKEEFERCLNGYYLQNMDRCLFQNTMNISVGLPMRGWICIINRKRYKKSSIRIMITLCLITVHIPSKDLIKRPF